MSMEPWVATKKALH